MYTDRCMSINDNNIVTREEFESLRKDVADIKRQLSGEDERVPTRGKGDREIFMSYSPKSGVEKCFVIMSILDGKNEGGFNLSDIKDMYKKVKEKPLKNISDTISKIEKKGHINALSGKGASRMYQITNTGIAALKELEKDE